MAPIMPFITEELYQLYYKKHEKSRSIHLTKWPELDLIDEHAEHIGDFVVSVVEFVRKKKTENRKSLKYPVKKLIIRSKVEEKDFDAVEPEIKAATSAEQIVFEPTRGRATVQDLEIVAEF